MQTLPLSVKQSECLLEISGFRLTATGACVERKDGVCNPNEHCMKIKKIKPNCCEKNSFKLKEQFTVRP